MKLKITVRTTKNQAEKNIDRLARMLRVYDYVTDSGIISHNSFYWILTIDEKMYEKVLYYLSGAEVNLKGFYYTLLRNIKRLNLLASKLAKSPKWIKARLIERLLKKYSKDSLKDIIDDLTKMDEYEILTINDKDDIEEFLKSKLFIVEVLNE